ncbi:MAG: hypothetical protein GX616_18345, partial [Planctomycetes bacterium]|nr:hypothetical protein [Planctomycetota bacterium]
EVAPGLYEVFAYSEENPLVWGSTQVAVSHLGLAGTTMYVDASDTNLTTIGLSGDTYPLTGITVTSDPPGISNLSFRASDLEPGTYTVAVDNASCETREMEVTLISMQFYPTQEIPTGEEYPYSGVADGVHWIAALFPPPACPPNKCFLTIDPAHAGGSVSLSVRHPGGAVTAVPMPEGSGPLAFASGVLNRFVYFVEGPGNEPEAVLADGDLAVRNVRHGDRAIFVHEDSQARLEVAIVKNVTWSDVVRNNGQLPAFAPEFDDLDISVKSAITGLFSFLLDPSTNRAQHQWIGLDAYPDSGLVGFTHTNFQANYPGLATRDIPSARGVGLYPWDWSHFHLALATNTLSSEVAALKEQLESVLSDLFSGGNGPDIDIVQAAAIGPAISLMNQTTQMNTPSFLLCHTYENYLGASDIYVFGSSLASDDPIRYPRVRLRPDRTYELTFFPYNSEPMTSWANGDEEEPINPGSLRCLSIGWGKLSWFPQCILTHGTTP